MLSTGPTIVWYNKYAWQFIFGVFKNVAARAPKPARKSYEGDNMPVIVCVHAVKSAIIIILFA